MPTLSTIVLHERRTNRSGYQYQFTPKHHGADGEAAQWLPELSLPDEFGVFDLADEHDFSDPDGNLYGVLRENDELEILGTAEQLIAKFPTAREDQHWHGYPAWPIKDVLPDNRRGEKMRPAKAVFDRMMTVGLLNEQQARRLRKGKNP